MIHDFKNGAIDFSKITMVGRPIDPSVKSFKVHMICGHTVEISYDEMLRSYFIELWIESKNWSE